MSRRGKNNNQWYYFISGIRYITPKLFLQSRLRSRLQTVLKSDEAEYILDRVNYYNKLSDQIELLPENSRTLATHKLNNYERDGGGISGGGSAYFFDTYEFTRWFPNRLRWSYAFGDVIETPRVPAIVKSRPINEDNQNAILLNLDKLRHFIFLNDTTPFAQKDDRAIFYADIYGRDHRIRFMRDYHGNPRCLCGDIGCHPSLPEEWHVKKLGLYEIIRFKFIVALEGNDVSSSLKWIMSSNSLAVMPKPKYETWFMEGRLIPNVHYVLIKDDYSDLLERMDYYINHPDEAQTIIDNANQYVDQFKNKSRERDISLLVLHKYFEKTDQIDPLF